ncbi:GDP-fucose protein-O-fucosyltransferase [Trifolium pratense]|uniref:O-fucosyltransferase family protein n=1 Tax=Trifolium pratense TaxID=57577 RepID=A0A2K3NLS6_TRIPR|nr:GDP-fucose protein-O-fucosyltransferase [Trifolium pratense]
MDSSSDEEDDHHHLINQNSTKPRTPPSITTTSAAAFHVEDLNSRLRRTNFTFQKKYIIAIFVILIVVLLFSIPNLRGYFSTASFISDSISDKMKESELRAIYLLRQQQLALSTAFNDSDIEDLKSALYKQISINNEIQQILLNPHRTGKLIDPEFNFRKLNFTSGNYDRVLVIPSSKVDYQYDRVVDIDHINKCLGKKVVISFDEFSNVKKNHMHIDKFLCYFALPQPCYLDDEKVKKLSGLGFSMSKPKAVWDDEDTRHPKKKTVQDVLAKFSYDDDVMAIGDVFYAEVEHEWVMQPGGPIAHQCKTLIEPNRLILLTAQRNAKKPSCFYPIPQAADCILRVIERADAPIIYLSTDAAESETGLLQKLVVLNGKPVPLVIRPARNSAEKWDALLYRHGIEGDSQVEAMLDKTICAMSSVFIGAPGSTFTEDILRLRKDWGSASLCDEYLCQGEEPNIVAENE